MGLRTTLGLLQEEGLKIQPQKTQLATQTCKFLGHIVGHNAISLQEVMIEAAIEFCQPMTKTDVRTLLGLVGYYCQFINIFSLLAVLLSNLTKKDQPDRVAWTDECETSFQALKDSLCSNAILQPPCYDHPFWLQTDASDRGIGAVLTQKDDDLTEYPRGLGPQGNSLLCNGKRRTHSCRSLQTLPSIYVGNI